MISDLKLFSPKLTLICQNPHETKLHACILPLLPLYYENFRSLPSDEKKKKNQYMKVFQYIKGLIIEQLLHHYIWHTPK